MVICHRVGFTDVALIRTGPGALVRQNPTGFDVYNGTEIRSFDGTAVYYHLPKEGWMTRASPYVIFLDAMGNEVHSMPLNKTGFQLCPTVFQEPRKENRFIVYHEPEMKEGVLITASCVILAHRMVYLPPPAPAPVPLAARLSPFSQPQ